MVRLSAHALETRGAIALGLVALVMACAHPQDAPNSRSAVGLLLARRNALFVIAELVPGGPAAKAGVVPGDVVVAIDGTATAGRSISEVVALLSGDRGSRVDLLITPYGEAANRAISTIREPVTLLPVESSFLEPATLYIRIRTFSSETPTVIALALARAMPGVKTLVFDLRSNSGGRLDSAVRTAELILPAGSRIGMLETSGSSTSAVYVSEAEPIARFDSIFILVNRDTAAGAELFSLALRAGAGAKIVGERTLGFGRVETRWPGTGRPPVVDGVLRGPTGETFDGIGIEPDIVPPADPSRIYPTDADPLVKWLREHERAGEVERSHED